VGMSTIDFKLTDRYADVPENAAYQIETLLPMDGCVYPYRHIEPALEHPFTRDELGIARDTIVIGAFVSGLKLTRRCLSIWRDVLARIPRAKLAFSPVNPALRGLYERLAAAGGIAPDGLLFLPQGRNDAENQARYAIVDFVLDPMPYGGVNGVLEPLDAGVPVVTLLGKRHGERTAYSILANLGVTATIALSGREYVDIAGRLADDAAFMSDVRTAIRAGIARSTLTDRVAHTRALERAYIDALARKAPDALAAAATT
jgi:protein O-GlcNAc transferase